MTLQTNGSGYHDSQEDGDDYTYMLDAFFYRPSQLLAFLKRTLKTKRLAVPAVQVMRRIDEDRLLTLSRTLLPLADLRKGEREGPILKRRSRERKGERGGHTLKRRSWAFAADCGMLTI